MKMSTLENMPLNPVMKLFGSLLKKCLPRSLIQMIMMDYLEIAKDGYIHMFNVYSDGEHYLAKLYF